ncbi:MAG TPA: GNAT family N-acetyltransferase [Jatrophihabitans sp.]|nr:GNAT family N-acetyltransferase [Jatrophihabitans sp.]
MIAVKRYRTTLWLSGLVLAGWIWDLVLGGGRAHTAAWAGALLIVGGISALAARHATPPVEPTPDPIPTIRPAIPAEFGTLIEVEEAADTLFTVAGYGTTPGSASVDQLAAAPLLLVAGDPPVGYARLEFVDGRAHLEGLSVRPSSMRRGIGTALVQAVCDWAKAAGHSELTLCTFADVPWNGPFYAKLGFIELVELSPGLRALRAAEDRLGLDAIGRRVVLIRRTDISPDQDADCPSSMD